MCAVVAGQALAGLLVRLGPPVLASAVLVRGDLEPLAQTARGRYVLAHMPPAAQAMRAAGDVLTGWGCWRRSIPAVLTDVSMIAAGWSFGLWPASKRRDVHTGISQ